MRCPTCGSETDAAHVFCPQCGARLSQDRSGREEQTGAPTGPAPDITVEVPPVIPAPARAADDEGSARPSEVATAVPDETPRILGGPRLFPLTIAAHLVLVAVLLAAAAVATVRVTVVLTDRSTWTLPGSENFGIAAGEANAIDLLLNDSTSSRTALRASLAQLQKCAVAPALTALHGIVTQRNAQVARARTVSVDALRNGDALRRMLVSAETLSAQADQSFLSWAEYLSATGCHIPLTPTQDSRNAGTTSTLADKAKTSFLASWAPIAREFGLTTDRQSEDI